LRIYQTDSANAPMEPLTRRESQMLGFLAEGYSRPEIATRLTLGLTSVKFHIQHLYGKLGVNSKRQALDRAKDLGLLGPPAPAEQSTQKHNLQRPATRFFGREAEIARLRTLLDDNRLVTLTGSGGVGKTRLALRVAEEALGEFADGVWYVELAALSDPGLVAQQTAFSLGLRGEPGRSSLETVTGFLRQKQALLVLDNCEHLPEACAGLANSLLRACPALHIQASSRQPLGADGESLFRVPSLPFPDSSDQPPDQEALGGFPSVRLFVDRARLVLPDYQVAAHNAASIASICRQLDGIPLAIEMAAARLNILTADQLAGRLGDAFRLLTGGSRAALPRQQTLRATIDWSYMLLSEPERLLFQRLSVFAGGCTLGAAEGVCAGFQGEAFEGSQVLDVLDSLVAKSMVIADRRPGEEPRYRLLEFTRQYARERVQNAGDTVRLHRHHRDYFLTWLEAITPTLGPEQALAWERRLNAEHPNVRRALEWSFSGDTANLDAGPRLAITLCYFWPHHYEWDAWNRKAVALCQRHPEIPDRVRASLLLHASYSAFVDDPQTALTWLQQAVEIGRRLGPEGEDTLITNLESLTSAYVALDSVGTAAAALAEAEMRLQALDPALIPQWKYQLHVGNCLCLKALLANKEGRYQDAKAAAREGLRIHEANGMPNGTNNALTEIGRASLRMGEYEAARTAVLKVLDLTKNPPHDHARIAHAAAQWLLGVIDCAQGNLERALEYSQAGLRQAAQIPHRNIVACCLGLFAAIAARGEQPARAARLSGAAHALFERQGRKPLEDISLDMLLPGWRQGPEREAILADFEAGQSMNAERAAEYALGSNAALGPLSLHPA
jgi:predicted ATPase/DNA-binding CsgD family transcriptional regulator